MCSITCQIDAIVSDDVLCNETIDHLNYHGAHPDFDLALFESRIGRINAFGSVRRLVDKSLPWTLDKASLWTHDVLIGFAVDNLSEGVRDGCVDYDGLFGGGEGDIFA